MPVTWVKTVEQATLWDRLLTSHPAGTAYLLSWYLEHQRFPRVSADIAIIEQDGRAVAGAVLYTYKLPGGQSVCQVPCGPIALPEAEGALGELVRALVDRARENGAMLLQFEAFEAEMRDVLRDGLKDFRLRDDAVWKLYHPTLWRDLRVDLRDKTPETLLMSFRQTTRQCVRKGLKVGATVEEASDETAIDAAYAMWSKSAEERGYTPRSREVFRALVKDSTERGMGSLFVCRTDGQLAAFAYTIFYGCGSVYIAGAYDAEIGRGYAQHLVQYNAMCRALERKIPYYSLAAPGSAGLRTFKQGFRPVLFDNWRFVTVVLAPMRVWLIKGIIGRAKVPWMHKLKKWAASGEK